MRKGIPTVTRGKRRRGVSLVGLIAGAAVLATLLSSCIGDVVDPSSWAGITPANDSSVVALAQDPFEPNIIYAGTSDGLVYRAYAANRANGFAGTGIPSDAVISSLAGDTKTPQLVYAGTSAGFYASVDRGDHWALRGTGLPTEDIVDALAVATPTNTLYGGTTTHGVYASDDNGLTWRSVATGLPAHADINFLFWEPTTQTLYTGVDGSGVYASTDGGANWTSRSAGLSTHALSFTAREPANATNPTTSGGTTDASTVTLYVGADNGIFTSTDGGQIWASLGFTHRAQAIALDPQRADWLYAGTDNDVLRSEDGGRTWSTIAPGINHSVSSLLAVLTTGPLTVLYAGAGALDRFPPYPAGADGNPVFGIVLLVIIFLICAYIFARNRQRIMDADESVPLGLRPEFDKKVTQEPAAPSAPPSNSLSYEQYSRMMAPPPSRSGNSDASPNPSDAPDPNDGAR